MPGQLAQERVGLRFPQRQRTEKLQYRAGFVQRNADDIDQKRQDHQDLQAVFAAGGGTRDARLGTAGTAKHTIPHQHGAAIHQPPHSPLANQPALVVGRVRWIHVFRMMGVCKFHLVGTPPRRFLLASPPSLLFASALLFSFQAVSRRRQRRLGSGRSGFLEHSRLVLREPPRKPIQFRLQPLDGLAQLVHGVEQLIRRQSPIPKIRSQLPNIHASFLTRPLQTRQDQFSRMVAHVAAVEALASEEKISQMFVLGHSLGGMLLPRIGKAAPKATGFISLAGSTRPLEDLVLEQTRYILGGKGQDKLWEIEQQVAKVKSPKLSEDTPRNNRHLRCSEPKWHWRGDDHGG